MVGHNNGRERLTLVYTLIHLNYVHIGLAIQNAKQNFIYKTEKKFNLK